MKHSLINFPLSLRALVSFIIVCFCFTNTATAQDSKGTNFWICFPGNASSPNTELYITGTQASTVTIAIPGISFNQVVNVAAGGLQVVSIPGTAQIQSQFVIENKGIHITATNEVTVYGMNALGATTDAFLAFPVDALGKEYYVLGYNRDFSFQLPTQATILATENSTTVTITTSVTGGGFTAGTPQNITMQQGQVYQLRALTTNADYTGTKIVSNKPISVFGGAQCTNISGNLRACDHLVEQLPPLSSWGKSFVTVPLATRLAGDVFRFLAQKSSTKVSLNGVVVATLNAGQHFETILGSNTYNRITSNEPILVGQYSRSTQADGVTSDPFFSLVPPAEQFLNNYTISAGTSNIPINFLNITSPTANKGTVKVDGTVVSSGLWNVIPGTSFSGAKVQISAGVHRITSSLPIGLLVYGFGTFDSYGYLGGQSFSPVANVNSLVLTPATASKAIGTEQCFNALVKDQFGNPVVDVRVDFAVTGVNPSTTFSNTNASGIAQFCYTGTNTGTDNIVASLGSISDASTMTWTTVVVSNVYYSKPTGDLHNVLTWGVNTDGSGANPPNFGAGKTFNLANRTVLYTMTGDWTVGGILFRPTGSQLQINGHALSVASLTGTGTFTGSTMSDLTIAGNTGGSIGSINFTAGGGSLKSFTMNRTGASASATIGTLLSIYSVLNITNGTLNTANLLTLKSNATTTARVGQVTGIISGNVTVERYIPGRRAWRLINSAVGGTSGASNGQAMLTHFQETVQGTLLTSSGGPRPLSFGTATFSLNQAHTAITVTATINNIDVTGTQTADLNDNLTAAHIHVGALPGANAPVRWGFFGAPDNDINPDNLVVTPFVTGVGGTISSTWNLPEGNAGTTLATNLPDILAGLAYINFHTVQFGGGEVRGQINLVGAGTQTIKASWQEGASNASSNPNPGFGTHITGGPIHGSAANGFDINPDPLSSSMSSIRMYSNVTDSWTPVANTNATSVGNKPFMLFVRGSRGIGLNGPNIPGTNTVLRATGPLNIGNQTFPVAANGFTAVPNPFASPIDFQSTTKTNVPDKFYVWDPKMGGINGVGAFVSVSWNGSSYDIMPTPVSPISQNIQSGQSFLVKANGSAGSLVIKEGDKSATSATNVFGALAVNPSNLATNSSKMVQGIKINLKIVEDDQSTGLLDGVFVSFNNNFSNEIDDLDVTKPANINENFAIVKEGQALMVERRSIAIANETVQFKFWNVSERRYLLDIDPINLSFSGLYFYLRDNYLQTSTPINLDNSSQINFSVSKHDVSSGSNRFSLIISTTKLSTDILVSNGITTFPNPVKGRSINLRLINQPEGNYNVSIVNSLGQLVYNGQINHVGGSAIQSIYLKNKLTQGVYQLQVSKGSIKTSFKILSE